MTQTKTAPTIPAQNAEQTESEKIEDIIKTVALMGNRKDLTPKEKSIKALLKNIKKLDRLKVEHDKLKAKHQNGGEQ